jgi:DNA-directed RNA polymerase specialized sigma24 family protein
LTARRDSPREVVRRYNVRRPLPRYDSPQMPKERGLTPESFKLLLAWLDPDRDKAVEKYGAISHRLVLFLNGRGCRESEVLADETVNRVARKLPGLAERYQGNPAYYFYGVAKNVLHEYLRDEQWKARQQLPPAQPARTEAQLVCVEECMEQLPPRGRRTFEEYFYRDDAGRVELADEEGCSINALRIRVHRLRAGLEACVEECVKRRGVP